MSRTNSIISSPQPEMYCGHQQFVLKGANPSLTLTFALSEYNFSAILALPGYLLTPALPRLKLLQQWGNRKVSKRKNRALKKSHVTKKFGSNTPVLTMTSYCIPGHSRFISLKTKISGTENETSLYTLAYVPPYLLSPLKHTVATL